MTVPVNITDLSETASLNSPNGSETVGPNANDYLQALSAFIRQIYDGQINPLAAVSVNSQKITNLATGTVSSTSTDAVNGAQLFAALGKVGEIRMWSGAATQAAVTAAWGFGWHLADGTLGTSDLRDRFVIGAGNTYAVNTTGGTATSTLAIPNLPSHNHTITDTGHGHVVNDPGHTHGVNDPGHNHALPGSIATGGVSDVQEGTNSRRITFVSNPGTDTRGTGIGLFGAATNVSLQLGATGISINSTGSGTAFSNLPPYFALCYVQYTGA